MPTTARSFASTTISQPAARMRSPPTPKNWSDGLRRRSASISCAPYISPEASPAEIRICTGHIVTGLMERCSVERLVVRVCRDRRSPRRQLLILILQLIQLVINPALRQQLLV